MVAVGVTSPQDPAVVALLERGGRIDEPGTPAEELAWLKERKTREIERHADKRLRRNEPHYTRRARVARIALAVVSPARMHVNMADTRFDAETLACAEDYIDRVQAMDSIEAVREFDPELMAWPKLTSESNQ